MDEQAKQIKKELRQALLGNLEGSAEALTISSNRLERLSWGVADGAGGVLFFGIMKLRRTYKTGLSKEKQAAFAVRALQFCGRKLILDSLPEGEAALCSFVFSRPAILVYTPGEGEGTLDVFTARTITGLISFLVARKRFEEHLPEQIKRITGNEKKESEKK